MKKIVTSLLASQGLRQSIAMVVGNTFATGISAIALILISRLLGPEAFGEFSIGFALVLILIRFCDVGLNSALQKYVPSAESSKAQNWLFSFATLAKVSLSLAVLLLSLLASPWLADWLGLTSSSIIYAAVLFASVIVAYEHLVAFLQSLHYFHQSVFMNGIQATTKLVGIALLWLAGIKSTLLIFSFYVAAPLTAVIGGWLMLPKWAHIAVKKDFSTEYKLMKGMAGHSAVGFIAAGLIENIDVFFVQRYLSSFDTGLLSGISRIAMVFLLIAYSLANVLNTRVAKYKEKKDIDSFLKKSFYICLLCVVGMIAFIPFSSLAIDLTLGAEYASGSRMLVWLVASSFITIAAIPFQSLFFSFKADWYFSASGIFQLLIVVLGNVLFLPTYGLEATVWTRVFSRFFLFGFSLAVGYWYYRRNYSQKLASK
jgi:O-antigen/teichoic acid export membrane protein